MGRNRGGAISAFFESLGDGDPVTWGVVGAFLVVAALLGLFTLKVHRDMRREDEARARKHGRRS